MEMVRAEGGSRGRVLMGVLWGGRFGAGMAGRGEESGEQAGGDGHRGCMLGGWVGVCCGLKFRGAPAIDEVE